MRKLILWAAVALVVVVLAPGAAVAGAPDIGICYVVLEDFDLPNGLEESAVVCAEGLTEQDCALFCPDAASPEGGLEIVECDWDPNVTCEDLSSKIGEPWDGACEVNGTPVGDVCFALWENMTNWSAEEICSDAKGSWLGDGSMCGAPVPTLPRAGQAALMVILMLGALVILNLSGFLRSA